MAGGVQHNGCTKKSIIRWTITLHEYNIALELISSDDSQSRLPVLACCCDCFDRRSCCNFNGIHSSLTLGRKRGVKMAMGACRACLIHTECTQQQERMGVGEGRRD